MDFLTRDYYLTVGCRQRLRNAKGKATPTVTGRGGFWCFVGFISEYREGRRGVC